MGPALVIRPGHAEDDLTLRLDDALQNPVLRVFRTLLQNEIQRLKNLENRLDEFGFAGVPGEGDVDDFGRVWGRFGRHKRGRLKENSGKDLLIERIVSCQEE